MVHLAVTCSALEIFDFLVKEGAPLEVKDGLGETALGRAARRRESEMTDLLLKSGARFVFKNDEGQLLATILVEKGMLPQLQRLVRLGANPHVVDHHGNNLLHIAASADKADVIGYLLDQGVSTAALNNNYVRPADRAVRQSVKEMLMFDNEDRSA